MDRKSMQEHEARDAGHRKLISRYAAGDVPAISQLIREVSPDLLRTVRKNAFRFRGILSDIDELSQDIVTDVLEVFIRKYATAKHAGDATFSARALLFRMVQNKLTDEIRRSARQSTVNESSLTVPLNHRHPGPFDNQESSDAALDAVLFYKDLSMFIRYAEQFIAAERIRAYVAYKIDDDVTDDNLRERTGYGYDTVMRVGRELKKLFKAFNEGKLEKE